MATESEKETEQTIAQLQLIEQSLQNLMSQKQQFQLKLVEIESALKEMESTTEIYKIVGPIMVLSKKEDILSELDSKKGVIELRIKNIDKQEIQIRDKSAKLRTMVMEKMTKS